MLSISHLNAFFSEITLCVFSFFWLYWGFQWLNQRSLGKCHTALENMWVIFKYLLILIFNIIPQWEQALYDFSTFMCSVIQSCLTLCDPMNCKPPGSSVHGIFQARTLEWVDNSYSRASFRPKDWTHISCDSWIGKGILYQWWLRRDVTVLA